MTVRDFQNCMTVLANKQSLEQIAFHGGEPFLFYNTLKRCIKIAHEMGQENITIITNGYWGGNPASAQRKLVELKKAGTDSIHFSVDAFHQEFVPFRSVHTAIDVAGTVGFGQIAVTSRFLDSASSQNSFNRKTEEYIERLRLPGDVRIERSLLRVEGRAADELTQHLRCRKEAPEGRCALPLRTGENLKDPQIVEIDFLGNVTTCAGICIGNTKTKPLSRLLEEYDYRQHPIVKAIVDSGPFKLLEMPEVAKTGNDVRYVDECHLCYDLRRQLRRCYPELLAPENCYKEQ